MELISCENLVVKYGEKVAVDGVSFKIYPKDYIVILGENGSGKSTLLRGMLGLKRPASGGVIFNFKRNEVGYMPQKTALKKGFPASVQEVVLSGFVNGMGFSPFFRPWHFNRLQEVLKLLKIENLKTMYFKNLSKGQQQKVFLARAIIAAKRVLFLDEPCAGVDPIFAEHFYVVMKMLNEKQNIAIVMVSHDIKSAIFCAKKILHINKKLLFFGEVAAYLKSNVSKAFLKEK